MPTGRVLESGVEMIRLRLIGMLLYMSCSVPAILLSSPRQACGQGLDKSVRVLYLVPRDREFRDDYEGAIARCVVDLQAWYYGHLKGRTFRLNNPIVEVKRTGHDADWYDSHEPDNHPERKYYTWHNVFSEASELWGVKSEDPDHVWLIYIDARGGTGAGLRGVAILPEHDLLGLTGRSPGGTPIRRWVGGSGHELGHAFGLEHAGDGRPQAIMQLGYTDYPACFLTDRDAAVLGESPFLKRGMPPTFAGRGRFIYRYDGGYFINVGGSEWEERKLGAATIYHFTARGQDEDYLQLLDSSRPPGAWIALPKGDKGSDILFRWEGEPWRKIYVAE
jgi:hypothetical protein